VVLVGLVIGLHRDQRCPVVEKERHEHGDQIGQRAGDPFQFLDLEGHSDVKADADAVAYIAPFRPLSAGHMADVDPVPVPLCQAAAGGLQIVRHVDPMGKVIAGAHRDHAQGQALIARPGLHQAVEHLVGCAVAADCDDGVVAALRRGPRQLTGMPRPLGVDQVEGQSMLAQQLAHARALAHASSLAGDGVDDHLHERHSIPRYARVPTPGGR